jgi:predicted nucleotidyltransferase
MKKIDRVLGYLRKYQPEAVILFGSYARGEADRNSDLDLVVIKNTRKRFLQRMIEVARLIDNDAGKVDAIVYTPQELRRMIEWGNPFIRNVLEEGKVVYEKKQRRGRTLVKTGRIQFKGSRK